MEVHKANPFLTEEPVLANPFGGSVSFNPFLSSEPTPAPVATSNPFISSDYSTEDFHQSTSVPSSNISTSSPVLSADSSRAKPYNPFVDFAPAAPEAPKPYDGLAWLSSGGAMQQQNQDDVSPFDLPHSLPADSETDLFHGDHMENSVLHDDVNLPSSAELSPVLPKRPPPPKPPSRPSPTPAQNTQQLILSVTGAMQATSDHLLDRLRAAAPSPIPGYHPHLQSPSPSPSPCSSPTLELLQQAPVEIPKESISPARPPPPRPSVPPPVARPATSSAHGFASIFGGAPETDTHSVNELLNLPLEVQVANSHAKPAESAKVEEIDLLGLPKPRSRTKDDILSLFNKKEERDLLSEDLFDNAPLVDMSHKDEPMPTVAFPSIKQSSIDDMGTLDNSYFAPAEAAVPEQETAEIQAETFSEAPQAMAVSSPVAIPERKQTSSDDEFDAFASRFEIAGKEDCLTVESDAFDPFSAVGSAKGSSAWGTASGTPAETSSLGFGNNEGFDSFLALTEPPRPPHGSPSKFGAQLSQDSDEEEPEFALSIKPRSESTEEMKAAMLSVTPILAPPPRSPLPSMAAAAVPPTTLNPFLDTSLAPQVAEYAAPQMAKPFERTDSQETPTTPLFEEDQSEPLEVFPRTQYAGQVWEMQLRQPNKKKITSQRFWKKVFVKLGRQNDVPVIQLYTNKDDKDPFQELPLQPCYSVSDISAQQFDQYGKIFTVKVQYVFYKERPGIRPGQVTKAERLTSRLQQFAAYAIQGDYAGVKEFGSDLKKLGMPVEHAPHISELLKLGTQNYEDLKQFSAAIEESLFRLSAHRDRALSYKTEEVQMTAVDEFYVEQDKTGCVLRQIARVRIFVLAFVSGMSDIEMGLNDITRQGKEVVGRHDIIPVITEEWIRLEDVEFHACVQASEFDTSRVVKFRPPDAVYIELLRFRVRPPKNRELPLQVRTAYIITGNKIEIRSDILVPGYISRKYGQIPCEDVAVRFPIPESWIYMFRVEKHFRYGSVKSSHRRAGKIKGIERFLGAVDTLEPTLIEVSSGSAKYEHQHRSIVWRMPRLPKEGQGAYTTHTFVCRINLNTFDSVPETLSKHCHVEFTMPATNVSHTTIRSLAVQGGDPPEKYVRYLARHEYMVEIEHTNGSGPAAYVAATQLETAPQPAIPESPAKDSDSDSD